MAQIKNYLGNKIIMNKWNNINTYEQYFYNYKLNPIMLLENSTCFSLLDF